MKNKNSNIRLGVNIDHVATIRNARGGTSPDPTRAALIAQNAGADGITAHLREDRRHISEGDIEHLKNSINIPLNLEMAPTAEMLDIAVEYKPNAACIVPENREEKTTEGGLDVIGLSSLLNPIIQRLQKNQIRVSLFIEPVKDQIEEANKLGVNIIELHTGLFCGLSNENRYPEYQKLENAVDYATSLGIEVHAGHGLDFETTRIISQIRGLKELNIGHFLIGEAIFLSLEGAIKQMRKVIDEEALNRRVVK
jgi:pyridoxine 5-phosphate synthase